MCVCAPLALTCVAPAARARPAAHRAASAPSRPSPRPARALERLEQLRRARRCRRRRPRVATDDRRARAAHADRRRRAPSTRLARAENRVAVRMSPHSGSLCSSNTRSSGVSSTIGSPRARPFARARDRLSRSSGCEHEVAMTSAATQMLVEHARLIHGVLARRVRVERAAEHLERERDLLAPSGARCP